MAEDIKEHIENNTNFSVEVKKICQKNNVIMFYIYFKDFRLKFVYLKNFTFDFNMEYLINKIKKIDYSFYQKDYRRKVKKEGKNYESKRIY